MRILRYVGPVVVAVVLLVLGVGVLTGYRGATVLSGSMEPRLSPGDLAITRTISATDLEPGDVLLFRAPSDAPGDLAGQRVIHRVVSIEQVAEGIVVTTQGDALEDPDPWAAQITDDEVQILATKVPVVGHLAVWFGGSGRAVLLGVAALLVGIWGVGQMRRSVPDVVVRPGTRTAVWYMLGAGGAAALLVSSVVTSAAWTDRESIPAGVAAGHVDVVLDGPDPATVLLPVVGLLPGDEVSQPVDVSNGGSIDWAELRLSISASPSTELTENQPDGLHLQLSRCDVPWVPAGTTWACPGTESEATPGGPIAGEHRLETGPAHAVSGTDHLLLTVELSASAPESMADMSTNLTLAWTAVQREGDPR